MVQSRATTPAREKTPAFAKPGYAYCPTTSVKVHDGKSLSPIYNGPSADRPDFLFYGKSDVPLFKFCFRTGMPISEVTCGKTGAYLVRTIDGAGQPLPRIFCTGSGNFLGNFCPITGKNNANGTKLGKLTAKTWDPAAKKVIPHKYCIWSGNNLNSTSNPGARASLPDKASVSKKARSSSAGNTGCGPRSRIQKWSTNLKLPKKPVVRKPKATKVTATAASKRIQRMREQTVPFAIETVSHRAVKKTTTKAAPTKKTIGAGVKKAPAKKAPANKAVTTPKAASKNSAPRKPPAEKAPARKPGAGVKRAAAKPKAHPKK